MIFHRLLSLFESNFSWRVDCKILRRSIVANNENDDEFGSSLTTILILFTSNERRHNSLLSFEPTTTPDDTHSNECTNFFSREPSLVIFIFRNIQISNRKRRGGWVGEFGLSSSVTRFGEISPLWQNFKRLLQMLKGPLSIWRI